MKENLRRYVILMILPLHAALYFFVLRPQIIGAGAQYAVIAALMIVTVLLTAKQLSVKHAKNAHVRRFHRAYGLYLPEVCAVLAVDFLIEKAVESRCGCTLFDADSWDIAVWWMICAATLGGTALLAYPAGYFAARSHGKEQDHAEDS